MQIAKQSFWAKYWHLLALAVVVAVGCVFYFGGVAWGFPTLLYPDEYTIVEPAVRLVQNHSFEPDVYFRPDHLLIQINSLIYTVLAAVTGTPIADILANDPARLYGIARVVSCCFMVGCVLLAYRVGRTHNKYTALAAACVFALFPVMHPYAHIATSDVPTTFFMLLFVLLAMRYLRQPGMRGLVPMCLTVAAFICVKYTGAILLLPLAITVIQAAVRDKAYLRILWHALATIGLVVAFVFLISPKLILDFESVLNAFIREARPEHLGADGLGWGGNLLFYVETYLNGGGVVLAAFGVFGLYRTVRDKQLLFSRLPFFAGAIYWVVLSYLPLHWVRWGLPMFVTPLLFAAVGIYEAGVLAANAARRRKLWRAVWAVCVAVVAVNLVAGGVSTLAKYHARDTRVASLAYCGENGITLENSTYETYTPFSPNKTKKIFYAFDEVDGQYYLTENRVEYIVMSRNYYAKFLRDPERYPTENMVYDVVYDNFTHVAEFMGEKTVDATMLEPLNIYRSFEYAGRMRTGMAGPDVHIYRAGTQGRLVEPLPLTTDFSKDGVRRYTAYGFSPAEGKRAWTEGDAAACVFTIQAQDAPLRMQLTAQPYDADVPQRVVVYANGTHIGELTYTQKSKQGLDIPVPDGERLELRFELVDAFATEKGDVRALGFRELTLSPAG